MFCCQNLDIGIIKKANFLKLFSRTSRKGGEKQWRNNGETVQPLPKKNDFDWPTCMYSLDLKVYTELKKKIKTKKKSTKISFNWGGEGGSKKEFLKPPNKIITN